MLGIDIVIMMPMIAQTTMISISVKPRRWRLADDLVLLGMRSNSVARASEEHRHEWLVSAKSAHSPWCHSIALSARASSDCGISMPSALAVFKLIASSKFVGCSTGRSAGFAPFRILAT